MGTNLLTSFCKINLRKKSKNRTIQLWRIALVISGPELRKFCWSKSIDFFWKRTEEIEEWKRLKNLLLDNNEISRKLSEKIAAQDEIVTEECHSIHWDVDAWQTDEEITLKKESQCYFFYFSSDGRFRNIFCDFVTTFHFQSWSSLH